MTFLQTMHHLTDGIGMCIAEIIQENIPAIKRSRSAAMLNEFYKREWREYHSDKEDGLWQWI
ncbi:hypothetical protein ACFPFV_11395 [Salinicoccus siamensis]|uniref:hypothetical protein n=1 Tax=Salinicoccus siamensis TaxID=381830 RepID=UPI003622B50C